MIRTAAIGLAVPKTVRRRRVAVAGFRSLESGGRAAGGSPGVCGGFARVTEASQ